MMDNRQTTFTAMPSPSPVQAHTLSDSLALVVSLFKPQGIAVPDGLQNTEVMRGHKQLGRRAGRRQGSEPISCKALMHRWSTIQ